MQLFKLTAEKTPGFPPKVLALYDQIIKDALVQIEALGDITNIDEAAILASVAPQSLTQSSTQPHASNNIKV